MSSPTRDPSRASRASPTRPPQTLEIFAHPPTPNPDPHPQTVQGTALETRGEVTATCYDTSGTRMATCTTQGAIHVWDRVDGPDGAPGTWRQTAAWAAHRSACRAVAFAGAEFGRCLASSSDDGTICLWRESVRAPGAAAAAAATAAAEDGSSEWERCAQLRDSSKPVTRLAFAPADHGLQLAAAGDDGAVRFYSPADQLALHQWELCNESEALRPGAACSGVAWRVPNAAVVTDADRFDGPEGIHAGISPPTLAVALRWPDGANDARVLCYDEAGMRWRVSGRVYEGPVHGGRITAKREGPPCIASRCPPHRDRQGKFRVGTPKKSCRARAGSYPRVRFSRARREFGDGNGASRSHGACIRAHQRMRRPRLPVRYGGGGFGPERRLGWDHDGLHETVSAGEGG